jgi:hypothetical protein
LTDAFRHRTGLLPGDLEWRGCTRLLQVRMKVED